MHFWKKGHEALILFLVFPLGVLTATVGSSAPAPQERGYPTVTFYVA